MGTAGIGGMMAFGPSLLEKLKNLFPVVDEKMPALFIGHGNPMNAILDNPFTRTLSHIGKTVPEPKAILVVSAHWLTRGTWISSAEKPDTIYDFGGFPDEMYQQKYPAPGSPELAALAATLLPNSQLDPKMGLDHGSWTILKHLYPAAAIPVFQVSIDWSQKENYHLEFAKHLSELRNRGILIIGSGNIVHNLGKVSWEENAKPFDWAVEFDEKVKSIIEKRDFSTLSHYADWGMMGKLAVPSNDHYLPLMYTLGVTETSDEISFPFEEIQNGSIAMRCVLVG